jgi:hypothetical protein
MPPMFLRVLEAFSTTPCRGERKAAGQVEKVYDKFDRVLRLNSEGLEGFCWEVARVPGDDNVGAPANCGSEYVPVVWIGEIEPFKSSLRSQ